MPTWKPSYGASLTLGSHNNRRITADINQPINPDIAVHQAGDTRYIVVYDIGSYEDRKREFRQLMGASLVMAIGLGNESRSSPRTRATS